MDAGGSVPWGHLGADELVGLAMNAPRMAMRRVYYEALAASLAQGSGDVPAAVVAAACESAEAARRLAFEINSARAASLRGF